MSTIFNLFDLAFFALTFFFAVFGFFRGFIKELAVLFIWVISVSVSYFFAPFLSDLLLKYSDSKVSIYASSRIIIFVFIFLTLTISTSEYLKDLKEKIPSSFNRSFGILLGICKSILIFAIIYSAVYNSTIIVSNKQNKEIAFPKWMSESKSGSLLKIPSSIVNPLVKKFVNAVVENFYNLSPSTIKDLDKKIEEINGDKVSKTDDENINKNSNSESKDIDKDDKAFDYQGYSKKDIEKMNHLINIIAN